MKTRAIAAAAFTYRFVAGRIKHEHFNEFTVVCVTVVVVVMLLRVIGVVAVFT